MLVEYIASVILLLLLVLLIPVLAIWRTANDHRVTRSGLAGAFALRIVFIVVTVVFGYYPELKIPGFDTAMSILGIVVTVYFVRTLAGRCLTFGWSKWRALMSAVPVVNFVFTVYLLVRPIPGSEKPLRQLVAKAI